MLNIAGLALAALSPLALSQATLATPAEPSLLTIRSGEKLTIAATSDGKLTITARGEAAPDDTPQLHGDPKVETLTVVPNSASVSTADRLVASFRRSGDGDGVLRIENGYSYPVVYDAAVVVMRGSSSQVTPTTICPVPPHSVGFESWPRADAIRIFRVRRPAPGDDTCSGASGLVAPRTLRQTNVCSSDFGVHPVSVLLTVDASSGSVLSSQAQWLLRDPRDAASPWLTFLFPMQAAAAGGRPDGLSVVAFASLDPPPHAAHAAIQVEVDDVVVATREWELFAKTRAQLPDRTAAKSLLLTGIVPIATRPVAGPPQPALDAAFERIARGEARTARVTITGDDGALIGQGVYDLRRPAIRDAGSVGSAYAEAAAKAAEPQHCAGPMPN